MARLGAGGRGAEDVRDLHVSKGAQRVQEVHLEELAYGGVESSHISLQDPEHGCTGSMNRQALATTLSTRTEASWLTLTSPIQVREFD